MKLIQRFNVKPGEASKTPDPAVIPQYPGHTFERWTPDTYHNVTSDQKIFTVYKRNTYTVTFVNIDTGASVAINVLYMDSVSVPTHETHPNLIPLRTGYTFQWERTDFGCVTENRTCNGSYHQSSDYYWVVFLDVDGHEIAGSRQLVQRGHAAVEPNYASSFQPADGKLWDGWSVDFSSVTAPLTVRAKVKNTEAMVEMHIKRIGSFKVSSAIFNHELSFEKVYYDQMKAAAGREVKRVETIQDLSYQITSIGKNACRSVNLGAPGHELVTVIFPAVTEIKKSAFQSQEYLKNISFPALQWVRELAFYGCDSLGPNLVLPHCTLVENQAFEKSGLVSIELPALTGFIGQYAFRECSKLQTFKAPLATSLWNNAFYYDKALQTVEIPKVTAFGGSDAKVFKTCNALKNMTINIRAVSTPGFDNLWGAIDGGAVYNASTRKVTATNKLGEAMNITVVD